MGRKLHSVPLQDSQVVVAGSATEAAMLSGARSAKAHLVKDLCAVVWVDDEQRPDMPMNDWASAVLGQPVRGPVVALVVATSD